MAVPDTLVGTDSHTTMINGLGVLGWGVGGIEAEAVMLGQPLYMLMPEVVGFELTGQLPPGATATDLVLTVTQILRKEGVVDKFVEFFGPGVSNMKLADRATIGNMAPEYGATMGFFPDRRRDARTTCAAPAARKAEVRTGRALHARSSSCSAPTTAPAPQFTKMLSLDLGTVEPSLAGPKRPQDRVPLRVDEGVVPQVADGAGRRTRLRARRRRPASAPATVVDNGHSVDDRPRRRRHRRHHQLHEHQQPVGDAGRRPAGQEGGRKGAHVQAVRQDQPGARLARGDRLSRQGRPDRSRSKRSASTPSATAARPASATAARCPSRWPRPSPRAIWSPRPC